MKLLYNKTTDNLLKVEADSVRPKGFSDNIVVQVKTQEEWDYVTDKLRYKWVEGSFGKYDSPCISIANTNYGSYSYYHAIGYKIISFEQFTELYPMNNLTKKPVAQEQSQQNQEPNNTMLSIMDFLRELNEEDLAFMNKYLQLLSNK